MLHHIRIALRNKLQKLEDALIKHMLTADDLADRGDLADMGDICGIGERGDMGYMGNRGDMGDRGDMGVRVQLRGSQLQRSPSSCETLSWVERVR